MSEPPADAPGQVTLARAVAALTETPAGGRPYAELIARGTLRVGLYAPRGSDTQQPHDQDEVYVVMSGRGTFRNGPVSHPFQRATCCSCLPASGTSSKTSATICTFGSCSTVRRAARRQAEPAHGSADDAVRGDG